MMAVGSCCEIGDRLTLQAHLKKIIDDTERRLNILFDSLNNDAVPKDALSKTGEIARGKSLEQSEVGVMEMYA
jgi:protein transport protein SEC31